MSLNVRKALYAKLAETGAITSKLAAAVPGYEKAIYHEQAPPTATYPYIIFFKPSGTKVRAMQTPESFKREVWAVKAVDRNATTATRAEEIAEAIDTVLDGGTLSVSGKTVADLSHVGDIDYPEPSGDQLYRHKGANYRITLT